MSKADPKPTTLLRLQGTPLRWDPGGPWACTQPLCPGTTPGLTKSHVAPDPSITAPSSCRHSGPKSRVC